MYFQRGLIVVLKIGNRKIKPGDRIFLRLPVTRVLDGSELTIPLHVICGTQVEPVLGLTALEHGGESASLNAVRRIVNETDTSKLKGTILAIPIMNPLAFAQGERLTPRTAKWPGQDVGFSDISRLLAVEHPGRRSEYYMGSLHEEDISITEAMLRVICDEFLDNIEYCIRFHGKCGGALKVVLPDMHQEFSFEMAKNFGMGLINDRFYKKYGTGNYLTKRKVPTIVAELGGPWHGKIFEKEGTKILMRGTHNIMKLLGMIEGEPELPEKQLFFRKSPHVRPTQAGYLLSNFEAADVGVGRPTAEVKKGDVLGTLFDPYSLKIIEELRAPVDGLLNALRVDGPVEAYMRGYFVADTTDPEAKWI